MSVVTKEFSVDAPFDETWDFFMTPEKIAPCVPGYKSFEEIEEDVFDAEVEVSVAYTTLVFDTRLELTDKEPPVAKVDGKAEPSGRMPGSATVEGTLEMEDNGDSTEGTIEIEFAIRGRLGTLGTSAFRHKCEEVTADFIDNVKAELEGKQEATPEPESGS